MPGVYISYPFCSQKCTFCNFASGVFPREVAANYSRAVLDEICRHEWRWHPETVYIGGGTPSLMPPEQLSELLAAVPGRPWIEATLEAAPGTITEERVRVWRDSGLNRVSLGVQSFVLPELAKSGRKHTPETVASEIALLRDFGIEEINIDLIAGLPHQTRASWEVSLGWVERLNVPHVSVYMLEVDEDSRLGFEILQGGRRYGAQDVPPGDEVAGLYELAVERLAAAGLRRYEISNFARPGHESRHNLKYWKLEPYVGFGADAHSFDGHTRTANVEAAGDYVNLWRMGHPVVAEVTEADLREEKFMVGLRLADGIEPAEEELQEFAEPIERFLSAGLLVAEGRRLRLSSEGILLSNEVLQEFIHS